MMMKMKYFIDESGHGGDLVRGALDSGFAGQPVFVLACIGVENESSLEQEVLQIRRSFNINEGELKSSVLKKRPQMALAIFEALSRHDAEVMVEVVNKRFFVCMNMVSFLLLPFSGSAESNPLLPFFQNEFAEYLYYHMPDSELVRFMDACDQPSNEAVKESLTSILNNLQGQRHNNDFAATIKLVAQDRLDEMANTDAIDGWTNFLPPPDKNKSGKSVWLLPNLPSLTNIYGRINLAHCGRIDGFELLHDEQAQFDEILLEAKTLAEQITDYSCLPYTRFSDYRFDETANLGFAKSHEHVGIQLADALAGFVMRYVNGSASFREKHEAAFQSLLEMTDPNRGIGINFVMPTKMIREMGIWVSPPGAGPHL